MHLSRAIAIACLTILKWMLRLVALLLVMLVVRQYFLGPNGGVSSIQLSFLAAGSLIGAWLCGYLSLRFERGS